MALPDYLKQEYGVQLSFADHAGDFAAAAGNLHELGGHTDVQLSLASLADNAARQSAKFDFGATWHIPYVITLASEMAATPTAGDLIEFYLGESVSGTAANANPGGLTGSDAAYTGYSSNLDASVRHLRMIGAHAATTQITATVQQNLRCGVFIPRQRYGILVVYNKSGAAFHSDDVESHVTLIPLAQMLKDTSAA